MYVHWGQSFCCGGTVDDTDYSLFSLKVVMNDVLLYTRESTWYIYIYYQVCGLYIGGHWPVCDEGGSFLLQTVVEMPGRYTYMYMYVQYVLRNASFVYRTNRGFSSGSPR